MNGSAAIHDRLGSLADTTRTRLLLLLAHHELSVGELCGAVQLPQSTVSRHLKVLADEGWVASRSEGPSRFYRMKPRLDAVARRLWRVVRDELAAEPVAVQDEARASRIVRERRARATEFFSSAAGRWDALRAELHGARGGVTGLLALLPRDLEVGDLGCGTGVLAAELAPFVSRVIAVDGSKAMLAAAKRRLEGVGNVELRPGELESLPLEDASLDAAVMSLVLQFVPEPPAALAEARRVLRPGGRLVVVDLLAHGRTEYVEDMGHVWQGFEETQMREWLRRSGFTEVRWSLLPPDPQSKGPVLFVASGVESTPIEGER